MKSKVPPKGIYWGDDSWFHDHHFSWFPDELFKGRTWQYGKSEHLHSVKLTNKITGRVSEPPDILNRVGEASAVYDAQILTKNEKPKDHIVVKIFMRIPHIPLQPSKKYVDKSDLLSQPRPIVEDLSSNECFPFNREFQALEHLTKSKCSSTPRYITHFQYDEANPWVRAGFLCFVVMEKVPGRRVSEFWVFDPKTQEQRDEQRQIQQAFKKSLLEVLRLGVKQTDRASRNVLWDKKNSKCYLIDFEAALYLENFKLDHSDWVLVPWGLETREVRESLGQTPGE